MVEQWQVAEIVKAGLPVRVIPLRFDTPIDLQPGEEVRWIVAASPVSSVVARRIAREQLKMISRWCGGVPSWLRQHVPTRTGKVPARAVCRKCGDKVNRYPSIRVAARAVGKSRKWLHLRLIDGGTDSAGCTWHDDFAAATV